MKKLICLLLTALMLSSIISVSFVGTSAQTTEILPFLSPALTKTVVKGFADEDKTYYKITDGTETSPRELAYDGNIPYFTQGATSVNGDYYISATFNSSLKYEFGYIIKYDTSEQKCYVSEQLPIGHANDLCYNADTNMIVVCNNSPNNRIVTLINADDLTLAKQVVLKDDDGDYMGIYAIGYDPVNNRYVACSSAEDAQDAGVWYNYILDENFKVIGKHAREDLNLDSTTEPYYLKQGICVTPDYIMRAYSGTPIGTYTNRIVVTDWEGNHVQTVEDTVKYEIEDIFFNDDGYCYFVYHHNINGGHVCISRMTAYIVKYLPNGGEGTMEDSVHYYGTAKNISANTFTREGYTFAGWKVSRKSDGKALYTNNGSTNSWYVPGQQPAGWRRSIYPDQRSVDALAHDLFDEVYLEAQWQPDVTDTKMFYIEFDSNGGTGSIPMFACTHGVANTLPENTITREDYKFLGWSARRTSTNYWGFVNISTSKDTWMEWTNSSDYKLKLYKPGQKVAAVSNVDGDIVEFMCQWEYIPNSIFVFDGNGATGEMENQKLVQGTATALTTNTFEKTGYSFTGWIAQKAADGTYYLADGTWSAEGTPYVFADGETVTNLGDGTGDKINMIAQWKANTYTVTFDANGGAGTMSDLTATYDQAVNLTANTFVKESCVLTGWLAEDGTVYTDQEEIKNLTSTDGEIVTLIAQWKLLGDVNGDGKVSIKDVTTIQLALAQIIDLDSEQSICADVDCDGELNIKDATQIQLVLAKLIDKL